MTKIGITGKDGRVGRLLEQELNAGTDPDIEYAGGLMPGDDPEFLFDTSDVMIDFTAPEATMNFLKTAVDTNTAMVIGTTGLSDSDEEKLKIAADGIPILYAANMSVGVNLLLALVEQAAGKLGLEWDAEILDTHHHHKVDSPSGTALALGKAIREGRNDDSNFVTDRAGKREQGSIGYTVRRGGDVVGEHTVSFYGAGERIELSHMATDRRLFANGAITGAKWLSAQPPGLYAMRDMLKL